MTREPVRGLFITGTNTHVGKTYVAARIARALQQQRQSVGVYKPVASGCRVDAQGQRISDDAVLLWQAAGCPGKLDDVCPQRFVASLAPHLAAKNEGKQVDADLLRAGLRIWQEQYDVVIVEGAGGLLSPVSDNDFVADLAADFAYPLIVVAANELGVINQTLQTLHTAKTYRAGLPVAGVILNDTPASAGDPSSASNYAELQRRCACPILAHLAWGQDEMPGTIDWLALARGHCHDAMLREKWPRQQ